MSPPAGEDESDEDIIVIEEELDGFEDDFDGETDGESDADSGDASQAEEILVEDVSVEYVGLEGTTLEDVPLEDVHAEELSADDVANLFDEVVESSAVEVVLTPVAVDFDDDDLLEDDVAQVLRDTAHLAGDEGGSESRA